ncbi:uncharacterized protein LOC9649607 [Selaginella moellendorffii]|nr:uncharacterized protein LOC9649607 [Selaginella moellendorffii]|eukprot:XP_002980066.2 uncharacterized protein LOC9649607 [Selaginella moellendorffii]
MDWGVAIAPLSSCIPRSIRYSRSSLHCGRLGAAKDTVRQFYSAINHRQLEIAGDLIASDCVYEDLVFSKPFVGRKAIIELFETFTSSVGPEVSFVIDEISDGNLSVGVTWHLDWRGNVFPFSKGCSFYRCEDVSGDYKIVYGRDIVEPAFKINSVALKAIGAVTWLFERFPGLARRTS